MSSDRVGVAHLLGFEETAYAGDTLMGAPGSVAAARLMTSDSSVAAIRRRDGDLSR
jgi:hypothetical protein